MDLKKVYKIYKNFGKFLYNKKKLAVYDKKKLAVWSMNQRL